jgi:beta-barrel assembly-enhancing protease
MSSVVSDDRTVRRVILWLLGGTLLLLALIVISIPYLLSAAASQVPASWERRFGETALQALANESLRCRNGELERMSTRIRRHLTNGLKNSPYTYNVTLLQSAEPNAFALPGGYMVFHAGLLRLMEEPEEYAAVMAHEMQHIEQRHAVNGIFRSSAWSVGLSLLFGDAGAMAGAIEELGSLRFSRSDEEAADAGAAALLASTRISPEYLALALDRLAKQETPGSAAISYLSTHPDLRERVEAARNAAKEYHGTRSALGIPREDWQLLRQACSAAPPLN